MVAGAVDEGCVGNWLNGVGANVPTAAAGACTHLLQVGNLGGAAPDGDGDIIVGTVHPAKHRSP